MNLFSFAFVDPTLFLSTMTLKYGKNFEAGLLPDPLSEESAALPNTKHILLRGPVDRSYTGWASDVEQVDYPLFNEWPSARALVENIVSVIRDNPQLSFANLSVGKVYVESVAPDGFIGWHVEGSEYAHKHQRFRLLASPCTGGAWLSGQESMGPVVGNLTYFNTHVLHSITNLGPAPQISVIVDIRKPALQ